MKNNFINTSLLLGTFVFSGISIAQKNNETSAAVAFKNTYLSAIQSEDFASAKKALIESKKYIDLAAENPLTKESPKTLWLKGTIYFNFLKLAQDSKDSTIATLAGENPVKVALDALKQGFSISDKFDDDIIETINQIYFFLDSKSVSLYNAQKFDKAAESYLLQADLLNAINKIDTNSFFNSAICFSRANAPGNAAIQYEKLARLGYKKTDPKNPVTNASLYSNASNYYRENNQINEAKAIVIEGRKLYPQDKDLLLEAVNTCLDSKDIVGAEGLLAQAISADPKNKLLHLNIGLIYIDLKENDKAIKAFDQALEVDPNYSDALRQKGGFLANLGIDLNEKINQLKPSDPKLKEYEAKSKELFTNATVPLEKYLTFNPNDKEVLVSLASIYRVLGNTEKSVEYKKKAAGIQ